MTSAEGVQATNDDASESKRCAVDLHYWNDSFLPFFVKHYGKKSPEINRGYFARVTGVTNIIYKFLQKCGTQSQIINLGAGFDTLFWKLKENNFNVSNFVEIDYPTVTSKKCYIIKHNAVLLSFLQNEGSELSISNTELHSKNYHIVGTDLRNNKELEYKLLQCGIDYNIPTLFIAECVLVYVEASCTQKLLLWISSKFKEALFINYEQINMNDRFGQIMVKNLRDRGCLLAGIDPCESIETQKQRFLNAGWTGTRALDMIQVYSSIPVAERRRIESIEFLDEHELLTQLLQHYAIVIAWKGEYLKGIEIT